MSVSPPGQLAPREHTGGNAEGVGFEPTFPLRGARISNAARPTVSGYLPILSVVLGHLSVVDRRGNGPRTISDPGWSRTIVTSMSGWCLAVGRRDRISGRSRSRTDKITSLSSWPLFLFAYSAVNGRSRSRTWPAKVMSLHRALAHLRQRFRSWSCRPRDRTEETGLIRASRAPAAPAS